MSKKSFKDNPALQFMSRAEVAIAEIGKTDSEKISEVAPAKEVVEVVEIAKTLEDPIANHMFFEAKSKRFNMLIRPSTYNNLKKMSEIKGTSVNDLINKIVEAYIENHGSKS